MNLYTYLATFNGCDEVLDHGLRATFKWIGVTPYSRLCKTMYIRPA